MIAVPYLWLLFFFLIPFFIVFKISLSQTAIAMPPYTPVVNGIGDLFSKLGEFSFDNYVWLTEDPLYYRAYIRSVIIAAVATFLTLLIGYPIAYGMARAPTTIRPTLLMLVILPFWTSFLIRVYAWIGILKPEGLLNQLLMYAQHHRYAADHPEHGYAILSASSIPTCLSWCFRSIRALEKMDYTLIEAANDLGCPPLAPSGKSPFRCRCRALSPAACWSSFQPSASSSSPTCSAAPKR